MSSLVIVVHVDGEWKTRNDVQTSNQSYVGGEQRLLRVSSNIKYEELVGELYRELCIDRTKTKINLSCQPTTSMGGAVIHINNDKDVDCFIHLNLQNLGSLTPLLVTKKFIGTTRKEAFPINDPLAFRSGSGSNNVSDRMPVRDDPLLQDPTDIPEPIPVEVNEGDRQDATIEIPPAHSQYVPGLDDIHTGSGMGSEEDAFGWGFFDGFRPRCEDSAEDMVQDPCTMQNRHNVEADEPQVPPIPTSPINAYGNVSTPQHNVPPNPTSPINRNVNDSTPQPDVPRNPTSPINRTVNDSTPPPYVCPVPATPINTHINDATPDPFHWLPPCITDEALPGDRDPSVSSSSLRAMQVFKDKRTLQDALAMDALLKGYQFFVWKSTKSRWEVRCIHDTCKWRVRAIKLDDSTCFQLRRIDEKHTCPRDQILPHHRQASARILEKLLKKKFIAVDRIYRPKEIVVDVRDEYQICISYTQAWRAKNFAVDELRGSPEESFALLPEFCHMLELKNPGTITHIHTDGNNHFLYFFMAIGASVRGFQQCIRPVICVDGAFLKGKYLGTLFVAVCKDGNNQIYPLAFGVGDSENDASWEWFMTKLRDAIGQIDDLVFISDRHKSLLKAINTVFPNAQHGVCCHHLKMNMKDKFKRCKDIDSMYWGAAKAYRISDFEE